MSKWAEKSFAEVCVVDKDCLPENTDPSYRFTYISLSDVEKGKILNSTQNISFKESPSRARRILHDYDVLMATVRPNLQAFAILDMAIVDMIASTGFAVLSEKDSNSTEYIYHYLFSDHATRQINNLVAGSNYPAISASAVKLLKINIPTDFREQRKIARILSTVDTVIEKTEAAIAKYKAIKAGMMRDLFTRGIDPTTGKLRPAYEDAPELYKQSELGWVPKEWEVDTLESSTDYVDYRGKTPPKSEFGIFLVTARNIKDGFIDYNASKEYIPESAYQAAMSRGIAEVGDVVITTEAPMGNVAQIDRAHVALAQRVIKYRGKPDKLTNDFLAFFLRSDSFQRSLIAESTGSTVLGIKGSRLHKLLVGLPKKEEQIAIVKMIKAQEALQTFETSDLHKFQQLKQGLMADLLTGKVRVKYEEEEKPAGAA